MTNLIGLMGYGGVGKSEVARILRERHGFATPHIKAPFAAMLHSLLQHLGYDDAMCGRWIDGDLKREVIPELGITSTAAQQTLGTEWGRQCIRETIWVDLWGAVVDRTLAAGGRAALESCRYLTEVDAIRIRGGIIIEVRRPGVTPVSTHGSEQIPAAADAVLHNDGTLIDLYDEVARLVA